MNICKNCGNTFDGKFCNNCGEKVYAENDRSFKKLIHEGFHFITHFEGKFFTTFKTVLTNPGKFSSDFCNGIRTKYFRPLSFFLFLVILYLLFPLFEGLNMQLYYHAEQNFYGEYAAKEIAEVMQGRNLTFEETAEIFHRKGEKVSKFLLFIILPAIALFSWLMGFRKRKFYYDHFIFSTEACSFFLLWGFLIFPMIIRIVSWFGNTSIFNNELSAVIGIFSVVLIYLTIASRRFFNFAWWYSLIYSALFIIVLSLFIENIYKFILFSIAIRMV